MSQKLIKGCVVYMSSKSGCVGYGNPQCISNVCEPLGEISLYGHNQSYKIHDIREVVYYPSSPSDNTQSIDKDLAGKIWDAAERNTSQKLFDYTEKQLSVTAPDKETFINSLNLDNTQIRDGVIECPKSSTGKHEYMIRAYNLGLPKQKECVICGYVDEAYTPL